ncbi:UDP-N-acetylmuramoylalanyl-D-glutamyl-2,6-diaminopimelate--D-alanyl-D-alanine ligase [Ancylobacter dichloromethanicus]|uniref:UDP-N-acetylmuramoyl-tripeptide--D-alanyl-D-alanine ligase n=1 Tax=Ancylobacter dichloromethanicus TaxID=518825 RepID=A0A9W6J619_9HYPH|nr:UDP-N-acetylmuramoylalanyl-D-glutamyl-2,6-diaminopimelate--D-alanyl-D-alanine ligase [Ancylobacter dichloromethanicus]MBS7555218.1 UDP-N-acetylmuramoylalanyl-D-glutamyl-2,6-diaminopimelate--D-alanyl-D-alanine ligase [Ancylobacter dichloromethanicus]GLK70398.1 UDP-N-acetylmuramoyl-tripeptide--D-alanyl-D-alanine ligase [Ancylobacter dichloromethanicus]
MAAGSSAASPLWTPAALARATGGRLTAEIGGVSIDTRTLQPGDVFFALHGDNSDGHAYVAKAHERGAALSVVERSRVGEMPKGVALLAVDDVLGALESAGRAARARTRARIVGVTGSVGKTTTKEALALAFAADGPTHASAASYNNHWGVPLSLARMPAASAYGVFELGMNHPGEIAPLVAMVRPHVAVVTTVEPVHIAQFDSVEAIADAKAEIFTGVEPGGAAVLNRDNPHFARLAAAARAAGITNIIGFGEAEDADARLTRVRLQPHMSTAMADIMGQSVSFKVGLPGRHIVQNALAVLAAAKLAGADLCLAALALSSLGPPPGRGVRTPLAVKGGRAMLIDESYNANPASMRAALAVLGTTPVSGRGRRIAVLGDMLELGTRGEAMHRDLVPDTASADLVFCAGPLMRALWEALPESRRGAWAPDATALLPRVAENLRGGDAIMVKGSNGSRMGPLVRTLIERFPAAHLAETAETSE